VRSAGKPQQKNRTPEISLETSRADMMIDTGVVLADEADPDSC